MSAWGRKPRAEVTLLQFDDAARALAEHVTGEKPGQDFVKVENDRWFVLARVVLEGAGLRVP